MDEYKSSEFECEPMDEQAAAHEQSKQNQSYNPYQHAGEGPQNHNKKDRKTLKLVALVAAVALVGSIGGSLLTTTLNHTQKDSAVFASTSTNADDSNGGYSLVSHQLPDTLNSNDTGKSLTPAEVYEKTVNAVVGIETEATTNVFGQEAVSASAGSGFILTEDGYVITNCHVVEGADTIKVNMYNGDSYDATLVGSDSSYDIAVLKIDATGLPTVSVGNSDNLKVGEEVVAIGNPLGELTFTMTNGILSALDREVNTDGNPQNMLQTNAAINSGNSGGPLFDMDGNVIGVTSAKYSGSTSSGTTIEGLGFAIPINTALKVAYDLVDYGYVKGQAYLGVTVRTLDSQTASYYSLPAGPRVESVNEGSCAAKAGVQTGDIIVSFNGTDVSTQAELLAALKKVQAGDTVEMQVYRAGADVTLDVTLDEKPSQEELDAQTQAVQEQQQQQQQQQSGSGYPDSSDGYYYQFPFGFGFGN